MYVMCYYEKINNIMCYINYKHEDYVLMMHCVRVTRNKMIEFLKVIQMLVNKFICIT